MYLNIKDKFSQFSFILYIPNFYIFKIPNAKQLNKEIKYKGIKILLIVLLAFYYGSGYCQIHDKYQTVNTDSLKNLISENNRSENISTYFQLVDAYLITDPDSCLKYSNIALEIAVVTGDEALIADAKSYMGKACYFNGLYEEAIQHYLLAYDYYNESKNMKKVLLLDELMVFAYFYSGNYDITAKHLEEIISHLKYIPDTSNLAHFIIGIGYFYRYMEYYEEAIPFFLQYLEINNYHPLPPPAIALNCGHLGYCYEQTGFNDKAIQYYLEDVRISKEYNMSSRSYFHLGRIYDKMDSLDKAVESFNNALLFYEKQGNVYHASLAHIGLGKVYLKMGKNAEAQNFLNEALILAEWVYDNKLLYNTLNTEIKNFYMLLQIVEKYKEEKALDLISQIHFHLYHLYDRQSEIKKALNHYILYHQTLDKYKNFELIAAVEEIQNSYESEKKEQRITFLSQENTMNELQLRQSRIMTLSLIGLFLFTILIAILVIRMIKIRSEQRSLILEQRLLRSQMNPHFIFNALSNITNLVENKDHSSASRFLNRFSRLVRHFLESSREDFIPLNDELENLDNYIEIQKLRFSDKFSYSISFEDEINPSDYMIPPMLIQPFVENAIEHGIKPKEDKGHISLLFRLQDKSIVCVVEDDGIGREKSFQIEEKSHPYRSYGMQIVKDRLAVIRKKTRIKMKFYIIDLKSDSGAPAGTRIILNLPYRMAL